MPEIPKGFATKLGTIGAAILAVVAVLQPFIADSANQSGNARFFATLATAMAVATVLGRMLQAAAMLRDAPAPLDTAFTDPDFDFEVPDAKVAAHAPTEAQLRSTFAEDAPPSGPQGKAGEQ